MSWTGVSDAGTADSGFEQHGAHVRLDMKVATWNVNSLRAGLPGFVEWLHAHRPDVLAFRETKILDHQFPLDDIQAAGYQACFAGQKTYNGVALPSGEPGNNVVTNIEGLDGPDRRIIAASFGDVRVLNDLILASAPMPACATGCWFDKQSRAEKRPSDHTPVIAKFEESWS